MNIQRSSHLGLPQRLIMIFVMLLAWVGDMAWAQAESKGAGAAIESAMRDGVKAAKLGPAELPFLDQGKLALPQGYAFIPRPQADRIMQAVGNPVGQDFVGLILPEEGSWLVLVRFEKSGYIKDDDAKTWNVDELLDSLKQGTEAANEEKRKLGLPELEVVGWVEKPQYDAASHRLVWSVAGRTKGSSGAGDSINYNTYALGREGYFSLNLVTAPDHVTADKQHAQTLLAALNYGSGKTYADYNADTDHTAEYGLAALVGGVALKKLGFFAVAAAFFAKFAKVIALAVFGGLAGLKAFFSKKKDQDKA